MERRSFLGSLLAIPILAGFKSVREKEMEYIMANMYPPLDSPDLDIIPGSGTFITGGNTFIACSGTIYLTPEQYRKDISL